MFNLMDLDTTEMPILPISGIRSGPPIRMCVEIGAKSDPGFVRALNEDHFLVARLSRKLEPLLTNLQDHELPKSGELDGYILAVADGLGGHTAGAYASRLVLRTGLDLLLSAANWSLRIDDKEASRLIGRLREYFHEIDRTLSRAIEADPTLGGMATTLTTVYTTGLHAFIVHVGDSRVYRYRQGKLEQMTRDHTLAQSLAESGRISVDEVRHHSKRHVLTNVISGRTGEMTPEVSAFTLQDGDILLLSSDGLHDLVDNETIASVLARRCSMTDACEALVGFALQKGGRDNISVIAARYSVSHLHDEPRSDCTDLPSSC